MKIFILLALLLLSSCKLKVEKGNDVVNSFIIGGNCHLVDVAQDALCIEYKLGSLSNSAMDTDCDAKATLYSAINLSAHFASYSPMISCRSGGKVGKCLLTTKFYYYYDNDWTNVAAEADCTSLSGTYTSL